MADLTYTDLNSMTYEELANSTYAFDSSGDSGGTCLWTEARITAIENQLAAILSKMDTLATPEDVQLTTTTQTVQVTTQETDLSEVLSKMDTLAKPEDVQLTTTTQTVQVTTQETDLSEVTALLEKVFALIARWTVSENVLTAYASDGTSLGVFTLTRDANGTITGVSE